MQPPAAEWVTATHAIVVCGHAIYTGGLDLELPLEAEHDDHWVLQSFQRGEGRFYVDHIRKGVEIAAADRNSLLIFSGGQTRHPHLLSEAQGYHNVATLFDFWGHSSVPQRTTTEEFARDSYDNVLFALARFHECVGVFPKKISMVSWVFKQKRFRHHTDAIGWPTSKFQFVGVGTPDDLQFALTSEARTLNEFKVDVTGYGSTGGSLGKKKMARNPYRRQHGYETSCPSLTPLLKWTESTPFPRDEVPWPSDPSDS